MRFAIAGLSLSLLAPVAFVASQSRIAFREVAAASGVTHTHQTRRFPGKHGDVLRMFTSGGAAVAIGDYDNDGRDDIYLTDSNTGRPNKLFHNEGNWKFREVAEQAGVSGGNDPNSIVADAVWFDYDNDGWRDLLIVRFGTPLLYRNLGNGKFRDVSAASGLNGFANTIAAIAFDYDADGRLDLLFGNYFKPVNLLKLPTLKVLPNDLDNAINGGGVTLWRNAGNGRFVDVTAKAGFAAHTGWTLDVGHGDFDNDGRPDVYLACDYGTDRIFFNNGDGTFTDTTTKSLGGFDTKKGMNVDVADYDNDGHLDVYVTNITDDYMKECNMLWRNNGDRTFTDVSVETGTCATLWGWSAKFADFDNDGNSDLFVTNGLRSAGEENYIPVLMKMIVTPGIDFTDVSNWPDIGDRSWSGHQRKKFYRNAGGGAFVEMSAQAGVDNDLDGRGLGIGDFDNDGRLDIVQTNADQPVLVYRSDTSGSGNWIQLQLHGQTSNADAIGARVILTAGGIRQIREVDGGNGYAGQSTLRVHFGIGSARSAEAITIRWPDGSEQAITAPVNRLTVVNQSRTAAANRK